jgi:hypothetical protein
MVHNIWLILANHLELEVVNARAGTRQGDLEEETLATDCIARRNEINKFGEKHTMSNVDK